MAEQNTEQARRNFGSTLFREIHKNSWLKKVSTSGDSKKRKEKFWVVFCVHDDNGAFLEVYNDNKTAVSHKPEWFVSLQNTNHITPTICPHEQDYEFVIMLTTEVVRLAAPTWDQMLDWVESLRGKLQELRILSPKENLYTKSPESRGVLLLPTRDPTSPLPPPPVSSPGLVPGVEPLGQMSTANGRSVTYIRQHPPLQRVVSLPESSSNLVNSVTPNVVDDISVPSTTDVFNFENLQSVLAPCVSSTRQIRSRNEYSRLYPLPHTPGPSNRPNQNEQSVGTSNCLQPAPQPYHTLREQQVLQLQKEMKHPGGVRLQLRRKDCISSIALVDVIGFVWVCGWKQKEHPMLYNALHIGDQLLSVDGVSVKSASDAHKILRGTCCSLYVNVVVRRVPFGQVFVIHREVEGQPLGIVQEGNTAVIQTIQADSLVARHGLTARAQTCDGLSFTNWVLTEINGRPLNLFFKENEVRDRLNSVGCDISILVQPLDLIKQLKKQMKSLRNYKDYILQ